MNDPNECNCGGRGIPSGQHAVTCPRWHAPADELEIKTVAKLINEISARTTSQPSSVAAALDPLNLPIADIDPAPVVNNGEVTSAELMQASDNVWQCGCYTIFHNSYGVVLERKIHTKKRRKDGTQGRSIAHWEFESVDTAAFEAFKMRRGKGTEFFSFQVIKSRLGDATNFVVDGNFMKRFELSQRPTKEVESELRELLSSPAPNFEISL